jgi:hypothetical protein
MTGPLHILLIVFMLLATPLTGSAEIYKYRDKDGRLNFVDDENKIPAEYRDRTKSIVEADDALGAFDSPTADNDIDTSTGQEDVKEEEFDSDSVSEELEEYQTPVIIARNRVLVPVEVAMGNRVAELSLLLDTGASRTVLHRSSLSELDLPSGKRYKARVAGGGFVNSNRIKFRYINVGPFHIKKASAMVINLTGKPPSYDGMLGMDFLKNHPYQIDFENQVINWEPVD